LLVMTPTNEQAREVGIAIRADRRQRGEIPAEDGIVLRAMDRNSKQQFDLPVSVGDRLRMFTRTRSADGDRRPLTSNGDIVEVLKVHQNGLRIRNADGDEGLVTWRQMKPWRAPKNDPVQVTYGYAVTIDTSQSLTVSDAILSMPDGSRQVTGYKAHTAGSRQQISYHLIASDVAERKDIVRRQPLGATRLPDRDDVIRNIATNFGRFETKRTACSVRLTAESAAHDAGRRLERVQVDTRDRLRMVREYVIERLTPALERIRRVQHLAADLVQQRQERRHDRGQGLSR
jgi:hypothetical protein